MGLEWFEYIWFSGVSSQEYVLLLIWEYPIKFNKNSYFNWNYLSRLFLLRKTFLMPHFPLIITITLANSFLKGAYLFTDSRYSFAYWLLLPIRFLVSQGLDLGIYTTAILLMGSAQPQDAPTGSWKASWVEAELPGLHPRVSPRSPLWGEREGKAVGSGSHKHVMDSTEQ